MTPYFPVHLQAQRLPLNVGVPLFGVLILKYHKRKLQFLVMEINYETGQTYIHLQYSESDKLDYQQK